MREESEALASWNNLECGKTLGSGRTLGSGKTWGGGRISRSGVTLRSGRTWVKEPWVVEEPCSGGTL